jgi:hypothetical protein
VWLRRDKSVALRSFLKRSTATEKPPGGTVATPAE